MKLRKQNGVYVAYYRDRNGKTRQVSTKQTNLKDANLVVENAKIAELEYAALTEMLTHEVASKLLNGKKLTNEEVLKEWSKWNVEVAMEESSAYVAEKLISAWMTRTGIRKSYPEQIDEYMVNDFVNDLKVSSPRSRKQRRWAIGSFCRFAVAKSYISRDPSALVKVSMKNLTHVQKEGKSVYPFTKDQFNMLVTYLYNFSKDLPKLEEVGQERNIPDRYLNKSKLKRARRAKFWLDAAQISYWTGLRMGDICQLEKATLNDNELVVWTDKKDKRVALPLMEPHLGKGIVAKILARRENNRSNYFFPDMKSKYQDKISRPHLSKDFKRWATWAGVEDRTFHSLRHSFVTRLNNEGKTLEEIGKLVAHQSPETTKIYAEGL